MKKIKNTQKTNFFKKIFIKFCRLLGYEIIDQSNFKSTSLNKDLKPISSTDFLRINEDSTFEYSHYVCPASKPKCTTANY